MASELTPKKILINTGFLSRIQLPRGLMETGKRR